MNIFSMSMHWDWDVTIVEFFNKLSESGFGEALFKGISYLGTEIIFILIFGITYYGVNKELTKKVAFPTFYTMCFGNLFKCFFNRFRPFQQYPDRVTIKDKSILAKDANGEYMLVHGEYGDFYAASSTSFPSGHSFSSAGIYTSFAYNIKKLWAYIVAEVLIILVMISRMVLGAHFFTDVVAGYLIGTGFVFLYYFVESKIENKKILHISILAVIGIFTLFSPLFSDSSKDLFTMFGTILGFYIGTLFEEKYVNFKDTKCWWKAVLRIVIGLAIAFGVKEVLKLTYSWAFDEGTLIRNIFDMLRYAIMMFVVSFVYPLVFVKFKIFNDVLDVKQEEVNANN